MPKHAGKQPRPVRTEPADLSIHEIPRFHLIPLGTKLCRLGAYVGSYQMDLPFTYAQFESEDMRSWRLSGCIFKRSPTRIHAWGKYWI